MCFFQSLSAILECFWMQQLHHPMSFLQMRSARYTRSRNTWNHLASSSKRFEVWWSNGASYASYVFFLRENILASWQLASHDGTTCFFPAALSLPQALGIPAISFNRPNEANIQIHHMSFYGSHLGPLPAISSDPKGWGHYTLVYRSKAVSVYIFLIPLLIYDWIPHQTHRMPSPKSSPKTPRLVSLLQNRMIYSKKESKPKNQTATKKHILVPSASPWCIKTQCLHKKTLLRGGETAWLSSDYDRFVTRFPGLMGPWHFHKLTITFIHKISKNKKQTHIIK